MKGEVKSYKKRAINAVSFIMDFLLERNLATKEVCKAMADIDDLIIQYKDTRINKKGEGQ